jgi:hypothetical protein
MQPKEDVKRLKAYEAGEEPIRIATDDKDLMLFSPFGPIIGRGTIDQRMIDMINSGVDAHVNSGISSELSLGFEYLSRINQEGESFLQLMARSVSRFVELGQGSRPASIQFDTVWVVSQFANTASPMHFHSGDVSGILYLKTPILETDSCDENYILGRRRGKITFLSMGKQFLSRSLISFTPSVGDFYLFPSWLLHGVEPFDSPGERRSLSFNVSIEL